MNRIETLVDVRDIEAQNRHSTIITAWERIAEGAAMLLVNDHDPIPLYYQFVCERGGGFYWEYLEKGPHAWRVRITKGQFVNPGFVPPNKPAQIPSVLADSNEPLVLDTRPIFQRGETPCHTIDESIAALRPGQDFILMVPFEPVPLYAKLKNLGFSARTTRLDDGAWQIEFKKTGQGTGTGVPCGGH